MATLTAVPAGGNWATAATWSPAQIPTAADDVILDATSGNVNSVNSMNVRSLDCTGYTGTLSYTGAPTLNVGTSTPGAGNIAIKLSSTMTYSPGTSTVNLVSTSSTTQTLDFQGKTVNVLNLSGTGSSYQLASAVTVTTQVGHTAGALDTNGQTCAWGKYANSGATTRSLTLGASAITISGTATPWSVAGSNFTLSAGTSTITLTTPLPTFTGGGNTYASVVFTPTAAAGIFIGDVNTFANLTVTGFAAKSNSVTFSNSQTITGTLTLNGNSAVNRLYVGAPGSGITLTAAAVSAQSVDLEKITGAGAASWNLSAITGLSGDCGDNSGITFTTPAAQTWSGTSGGNWSANAWSGRVPLPQDNATISSTFIANQTVTIDMPRIGKSIDFSGANKASGTLTLAWGTLAYSFFGSLTLGAAFTSITGTGSVNPAGRGTQYTVTSNGKTFPAFISFSGGATAANYILGDNLTTTSTFSVGSSATVDINGKTVTALTVTVTSATSTLTMGTGTFNITSTAATTVVSVSSSATVSAASGTLNISTTATNTRTIAGGGKTYGTLTYAVNGSTGILAISDTGNTFTTVNFTDTTNARTLQFLQGSTTTISYLNVKGTSGKLMSIVSSVAGTAATIANSSGRYFATDYVSVKDSTVTGGSGAYAGLNSTSVSGNTGWTFSNPPISLLQYDFSSIDLTKFVDSTSKGSWNANVTISSGQGAFVPSSGYLGSIETKDLFNYTTNSCFVQVDQVPATGNGTIECTFKVYLDASNYAQIMFNNGNYITYMVTAGANVGGIVATWNSTTMKYMRIRQGTGNMYYEGSSDGLSWTVLDTQVCAWAVTSLKVQFTAGYYGTEPTPGTWLIDNVNTVLLTKTQSSIARIANSNTKTQTATSRIAVLRTLTQSAIAKIATATSTTKTQAALARIANSKTKTQAALARIANSNTKTQAAVARIVKVTTKAQTAVSRIANTAIKTQSAVARTAISGTKTQAALARIAKSTTKTQTAVANIVSGGSRAFTQSATAKIAAARTKTQPAVARISAYLTKTQSAVARVANSNAKTQSAVAKIARTVTRTQSAIGAIGATGSKTQSARARLGFSATKTQTAKAALKANRTKTQQCKAFMRQTYFIFYPPVIDGPARGKDRFWRHFRAQRVGVSVLKIDGVYQTIQTPTIEQISAAEVAYLGGHNHTVSRSEAQALTLAGYNVEYQYSDQINRNLYPDITVP